VLRNLVHQAQNAGQQEETCFTKGRVIVRGKAVQRGEATGEANQLADKHGITASPGAAALDLWKRLP